MSQASRKRRSRAAKPDPWREQNALLAESDGTRSALRARLARFDDATLDRLKALFAHLGAVVAVEAPAADATIELLARLHDLVFPALSILAPARQGDRILAAIEPVRTASAELLRGGEAREHARFVRWQLVRRVDPAFEALDVDAMAEDMGRASRSDRLLVRWNTLVGHPLGKLTEKRVAEAQASTAVPAPKKRRRSKIGDAAVGTPTKGRRRP